MIYQLHTPCCVFAMHALHLLPLFSLIYLLFYRTLDLHSFLSGKLVISSLVFSVVPLVPYCRLIVSHLLMLSCLRVPLLLLECPHFLLLWSFPFSFSLLLQPSLFSLIFLLLLTRLPFLPPLLSSFCSSLYFFPIYSLFSLILCAFSSLFHSFRFFLYVFSSLSIFRFCFLRYFYSLKGLDDCCFLPGLCSLLVCLSLASLLPYFLVILRQVRNLLLIYLNSLN